MCLKARVLVRYWKCWSAYRTLGSRRSACATWDSWRREAEEGGGLRGRVASTRGSEDGLRCFNNRE